MHVLLYAEYMWGNSDATVLPYTRQRPLHLTNCYDSPIPYVYSSVESSDVSLETQSLQYRD